MLCDCPRCGKDTDPDFIIESESGLCPRCDDEVCDFCHQHEPTGCFQNPDDGSYVNICQGCAVGYGYISITN